MSFAPQAPALVSASGGQGQRVGDGTQRPVSGAGKASNLPSGTVLDSELVPIRAGRADFHALVIRASARPSLISTVRMDNATRHVIRVSGTVFF
jgi:hypothetical protein